MQKLKLILHTVKYLKFIQIYYQIFYRIKNIVRRKLKLEYRLTSNKRIEDLKLQPSITKYTTCTDKGFLFLNQLLTTETKNNFTFKWENNGFGKLWDYNLNYMDYLLQADMTKEQGLQLINYFIDTLPSNRTGLEAPPISIRVLNWVKFLQKHNIKDERIEASLYAQVCIMSKNIEYHLLANHLFENGFGLLYGAFAFNSKKLYKKAYKILHKQLNEQVLSDGGHFERTPMYHKIMLERILDCVNFLQNNSMFANQDALLKQLEAKASLMVSWIKNMSIGKGIIPNFNDSTYNISADENSLIAYAKQLNIKELNIQLSDSAYRRYTNDNYGCIVNIGDICPSYQPGHNQADTLNFELHINNQPFIVDTGISTYEKNATRLFERGTSAHNTVSINDTNSSEVWSGFRIGSRAKVTVEKDTETNIVASHNGYRKLACTHKREWQFNSNNMQITDTIVGKHNGTFFLHLAKGITPTIKGNTVCCGLADIVFSDYQNIEIKQTKVSMGYNNLADNYTIVVTFDGCLRTVIGNVNSSY